MKYKSDAEVAASSGGGLLGRLGIGAAEVDFSASKAIAKYDSSASVSKTEGGGGGKLSAKLQKIRLASGETRGSTKIVEAAPLIYPEIDEVVYSGKDGEETFKDKTKDAKKFLAGYVDRRAQTEYVSSCHLDTSVRGKNDLVSISATVGNGQLIFTGPERSHLRPSRPRKRARQLLQMV
jgi:hypothetical protein